MATNITLRVKTSGNKERVIYKQATPDNWGEGEPPSPIEIKEIFNLINTPHKCQCGGGMTCLIDRRNLGYWVMEDELFRAAGCKLRINCFQPMTKKQQNIIEKTWKDLK